MNTKILDWLKQNLKTRRDWGIALTALTPLAMIGRAPADYTASAAAILFLFDSILRCEWKWMKQPWVIAALLLWVYSVVRAAFVSDGGAGLFAAFVWLRYIVFAASVVEWTLAEKRGRSWLLYTTAGSVLFLSVDGLIQYVFGHDILGHGIWDNFRLTGIYTRPILGITIANLFAPAIFWLLDRKQIFLSILLADVCLAAVFFSGDRMGLVLAAFVMLVWIFFLMHIRAKRWRNLAATFCLFAVLISLPHLSPTPIQSPIERQVQSTAAAAEDIGSSPYGLVWHSAWNVGKEHPFFGVGMRQFRVFCPDERFGPVLDPKTGAPRCYTHPHNPYMEWFSEGGIAGLLCFAGFVLTVTVGIGRRLHSRESDLILWGIAAMLAIRLMPLFISTSFFNNWSAIPFWLAVGWAMSYKVSFRKPAP
jgi:O-antigen ligase